MTGVLLCPGPSLAMLTECPPADIVCGVNRAAIRFAVDAWVCRDWISAATTPPGGIIAWQDDVIGSPTLISGRDSIEALEKRGRPWRGRTFAIESLMADWPGSWTLYSATEALVYLSSRGVRRVHVWGVDMAGEEDWDGRKAGAVRDPARWQREAQIWRATILRTGMDVIRNA